MELIKCLEYLLQKYSYTGKRNHYQGAHTFGELYVVHSMCKLVIFEKSGLNALTKEHII